MVEWRDGKLFLRNITKKMKINKAPPDVGRVVIFYIKFYLGHNNWLALQEREICGFKPICFRIMFLVEEYKDLIFHKSFSSIIIFQIFREYPEISFSISGFSLGLKNNPSIIEGLS